MRFDSMAMAAVVAEMRALLGGQVQQVHQPEEQAVVIVIRAGGRNCRLLLSAHARHARAHFVAERQPHPKAPPAFCMLLRKHLNGAFLEDARQVDFDRILHLRFRCGEREATLILEVMGKHSNLMLVSAEGAVLDAIKRVKPQESRVRPIHPGVPYTPPPTGGRTDPASATVAAVQQLLSSNPHMPVAEALRGAFHLGPSALDAVLVRCQTSGDTPSGEAGACCLASALHAVADPDRYAPAVRCDSRGVPVGVSFLSETPAGEGRRCAGGASEALEAYFSYQIVHEAAEGRRRALLKALSDAVRFSERRISEAEKGVEAARRAPNLEREATLLVANLTRVRRGAESVTVVDFYDPGQKEVTLHLDPSLTPHGQAERWFKRARKLVSAVPHLERQWEEEQERLEALRALRPELESARTTEEIEAAAAALERLGALRQRAAGLPQRRPREEPGGQRRTIGRFEVLLGRNAAENDYVTTRAADPDDLWLHARGIASAHVVIRTGRRPERVPPDVLREAARLCALHSSAKHSRLVPVDYTLRKHVVKRRGSAPGEVQYTHEKTLHVEPGLH